MLPYTATLIYDVSIEYHIEKIYNLTQPLCCLKSTTKWCWPEISYINPTCQAEIRILIHICALKSRLNKVGSRKNDAVLIKKPQMLCLLIGYMYK